MENETQQLALKRSSAFDAMNALTDKQRNVALDAARKRIVGPEPVSDDEPALANYAGKTFTKYPPELMQRMRQLGYLILAAAFFASAIRIFIAAFETSASSIPSFPIALMIGLASVLLAESGQVAFTLWAATTDNRWLHAALLVGATGCTAFALIANAQVVLPWKQGILLAWVETFLPPVLVLIASHVMKSQTLHAIEERYAAQQAYEADHEEWADRKAEAVRAWRDAYDNAHLNPRWTHVSANALRDALVEVNARKTAVMRELSDSDWRALVLREMASENWYERAESLAAEMRLEAERQHAADALRVDEERAARNEDRKRKSTVRLVRAPTGITSGVRTGETKDAVRENDDGTFTATCPYCAEAFVRSTQKGATNALPGHFRKCVVRKAQIALQNASLDGVPVAIEMSSNGHSEEV